MSAFGIIVNILAIIALVVILSYVIYYIYGYIVKKQNQHAATLMNPPGQYMQNSGIKCPDYWVNTGIDPNGNYICTNSFNVPTVNPKTGAAAGLCSSDRMVFSPVAKGYTWEMNNPNGLTSYTDLEKYNFVNKATAPSSVTRCQWINNCGPSSNIQGIWSGVNEICNSPAPSSS